VGLALRACRVGGVVSDPERTPIVFVELQLRPDPPLGSEPYFWGTGMLDFLLDGRTVWRAELPLYGPSGSSLPAHVQRQNGYGWVLVLRYSHSDAWRVLDGLGLPDHVAGKVPS
jgi:hypothetical protein